VNSPVILRSEQLSFSYGNNTISFPDIHLSANEKLLILGNSGSGKTTLIHLLCGLLKPKQGKIWVNEESISDLPLSKMDVFRGKNMGLVYQDANLINSLTVEMNIKSAGMINSLPIDTLFYSEILSLLGISHLERKFPHQLSRGEAQRVAIARGVINKPILLFADEPTANLDDKHTQKVMEIFNQITEKSKTTLIVSTHDHRIKSHFSKQITLNPQ
jgi:ABC-type lipoprotein export system ATPase subunit